MDKMTQEDRIKHYAHLIQRQTGKAVRPYRADGYVNMVNRYGTSKDSSEQYNFVPDAPVADDVLEMHYENNGLFSKIIDMPAEEAIKHGFTIEDVEDGKLADFYSEALDELNWEENAMTAVKWARLFGGSIAIMLVNDGRGLEEPLDWKNIQSIDDIRVYDRSLISPDYSSVFNYDPQDPFRVRGSRLGMPEYYDVYSKYGSFRVHDSRCLVFQNGVLPENATNSIYQFWGIPEYIRLNKAIRDADVAHRSAPKLLERSVQPIYKMKDLAAELATEQGEDRILKRLQVIDTARGILNSLVIDADGEDYDFKTFQYNGITDVISASCNMLAALSNIPQVILFGQTISGMSSTDDTSMENYYNYIERIQKRMLRSNLRYLLSVVFQAGLATGEVDEVPKLKVQFNPLWSVSDSEQATLDQQKAQTEQIKAQTAQIYVGMEAIDPSEVRSKLADSDDFDVENMLDEYTEEELEAGMPSNDESQEQTPADGQPATPDSQPTGNDEKAGPGQLLNEKTLSAVGNNAKYPATMETKVSSDPHENKEGTEGDAPASAPAATKKPSDMDPEEKAKAAQSRQNKAKDREDSLRTDDNNSHSEDQKGSVGVIVVNGGRVLNGTRHNDFGYGLVCGPGGHIEEGETPEQAAFRETKEEFGITPKSLMCLGQGPKEKDTGLKPYLFLCTEYYGTPNCEDLEMTGAKFSTIEELNEKAESLFGPFADGLNILMDCLETGIFYTDPAEGVTDEKLNAHLEKAMNSDGGSGSGNFGHEGRPGKVGGSAESHNFGGLKNSELSSKMNGVFDDAKIGTRFSVKMNGVAGKDDYEIYKVSDGFYVRSKKGGNDIVKSVDKLVENCGVYVTNLTSDKVMYKEANIEVGEPETEEAQSFTRAYESCRKERERLASGNYKITEVDDATAKKYADTLNKASKAKIAKLAMDDPQFKAVVDNISAYTQGEYVYQRKATEKFISNGYDPSNDAILGDRLTDSLYLCKDMYKGQNLSVSSASVTEGMANLTKAVNCSDPFDGELYRVAQDRSLMKTADSGNQGVYTPPKPGETISIVAPTSFSKDKAAIDKIAKDKSGDIIYYTVQPGAHAVDVSKLSPYKQAELLTCGEYEVVSVDSKPQRVVMTQTDRFTSETIDSLKANRGATVDDGFVKFPILETHVTLRQKEPIHMDSCDDSIHRYRPDDFSERMVYDDEIDLDGGPGSGNYGHEGVPGEVGGSAPSDSHSGSSAGSSTVPKFKSLIPKDSYFNSSSYNKAVEDFRGAIRKHDEAWKKYRELEKALKSESTPKPESEWDDNDIFEDLIDHRPMTYTEKGKKIKSEMDKTFKDACVYDNEQTETGDKLREIKKKEHDKQVKNIHFQPPADASSDDYEGFTTKTTGTSAYDDYINGERNGGRIAEMSPAEYLKRCAYQVFEDATIESTLAAIDESNVKKYADMMKNGTKFDMPYLNFMSGQQEGRHRAAAAMQAGIDKIPVLVVGEMFAKYDGGKGSGNWGHEGRKGKLGGSAPGGGMHNRISEEGGTYTSFSKKQKKLATPHTASAGELDNLPNNTKVVVDTTFGKYSMVYNAKYGAFIGQDGVEMYPKDIEDSFNGDDNKLQVFIPNEASTNYSKLKQSFDVSLSRMASAKSYARPQDADNDLRADTGSVWKTLSDKQKKVLRDYTGSDFSSINYSLRKQRGTKENCDRINDMTAAISKSKTKQDMWLSRGVDFEALPSMFGIKPSNFREDKIGSLVGKSGKDEGFMSCGTTTQTGYSDGSDVDLKIYVPKGSEAMYAEPFARFGSNPESNHWNGESHQSSFSSEMETILQRGSHFQCTKATYDAKEQKYHIEIAVTSQEHKNLDW